MASWLTLMCGAADAAAAAPEDPEALIKQGIDLRRQGDDARAEVYLRRAYEVAPTPRSAAQLGLVEMALHVYDDAEHHLSEALASDEVWIKNHRELLEKTRAEVRKQLVSVEIMGAPRVATVVVGSKPPTSLAANGVVWALPGAVSIRVEAPGQEAFSYARNLAAGQSDKVAVQMPSTVPATASLAPPPIAAPSAPTASRDEATTSAAADTTSATADGGRAQRIAGIAIASVGVASVVTGVVLYQMGGSKLSALEKPGSTYDESNGNWQTLDNLGVGFMVGGAVAVAGGAALYWIAYRERPKESAASVSLRVGSGTDLVLLSGAF